MEQGPVLILTFQAQQVTMVKDKKGNVIEGGVVRSGSRFTFFCTHQESNFELITKYSFTNYKIKFWGCF